MTSPSVSIRNISVISTFEKTCRAFLKALGPLLLLSILMIAVCVGGLVFIAIFFGGLVFVLEKSLGLEPGSIRFILAMLPAILGVIVLFVAVSLKFSVIQYKVAAASADGKAINFMEIIRGNQPDILSYFILLLLITVFIIAGTLAFGLPIFLTISAFSDFITLSSEFFIWVPLVILVAVPGIIIALALGLSSLAMILEGKDISGALRRSRDLTRNNRWQILGLYVLACLLFFPASLLTRLPFVGDPEFTPILIPLFLLNLTVSILYSIFSVVLTVTIYRELRALKDGPALTDTASPEPSPVA